MKKQIKIYYNNQINYNFKQNKIKIKYKSKIKQYKKSNKI